MSDWTPTPWKPYEVQVGNGTRNDNLGSDLGHVAFFEFEDDCARAGACVSFFHGRDIPTERIPEGGFWEVVAVLKALDFYGHGLIEQEYDPGSPTVTDMVTSARDLLAKLGVEE